MEKKSNKVLIIVIIILFILLVLLGGYICYDKFYSKEDIKTEEKENVSQVEKEEKVISMVFEADGYDSIYGLKNDGTLVSLASGLGSVFKCYDISDNKLYYVDQNNIVHYVLLEGDFKDVETNVKVSEDMWDIYVDNNNMFVFADGDAEGWFLELYALNTGDKEKMNFTGKNLEYFINDNYYYSDEAYNLKVYNVKTKEEKLIAANSRILLADNNYFLYASGDLDEIYLYDIKTEKSSVIAAAEDSGSISKEYFALYDDVVYYVLNHHLYKYENNTYEKLISLGNDAGFEYDILKINADQMLITAEKDVYECGDTCDEVIHYIYNIKDNKLKQTTYDYSILVSRGHAVYNK